MQYNPIKDHSLSLGRIRIVTIIDVVSICVESLINHYASIIISDTVGRKKKTIKKKIIIKNK